MALVYPVVFIEHPTEADHAITFNGINNFARSRGLEATAGSYFYGVYDDNKKLVGVISGFDNFGPTEIGALWVSESIRGQGYGRALIERAEEWGRSKGSSMITVFTLKEWPVCALYQKLGFTVEFERKGHAKGSIGCYLMKRLP
jgi:ribosomal protein S18 acetylase RimI-like enzyme